MTAERGLEQLERPPGFGGSTPYAVSANGTLIGGLCYIDLGFVGYLWNEFGRAWKAADVFATQGADMSHWKEIQSVTGISDNGLALTGIGLNIDGKKEAFLAQLDHINLFGFSSVQITDDSVVLSWLKEYSTVLPQVKTGLNTAAWNSVTQTASLNGDYYMVTIPRTTDPMFFRLTAQ